MLIQIMIIFVIALSFQLMNLVNPLIFPEPMQILISFIYINYTDIFFTLYRVLIASILGVLAGLSLGIFFGLHLKLYGVFEFLFDFLRSLPVILLFPITMIAFGIGDLTKIMLASFTVMLIVMISTIYGIRHANKSYQKMAIIYKVPKKYMIRKVIIPSAMPHIFSGTRLALSWSLVVVLVTEMFLSSTNGIGHAIMDAQLSYNIAVMYALIIIAGFLGYIINKAIYLSEKKMIHWT